VTGRWVSPVKHDRTRPVVISHFWMLTGNDRTLRSNVRSLRSNVSDHHLTVGIRRSVFEERGHVACITRSDAEVQRPVNLTGASGWPVFSAVRSPTALFVGVPI
jgi:hypothetical protein